MKLEDIKTVGGLGAGVMGGGISQVAALAGYKVITRDLTDEILAKSKDTMINGRFGLKGAVERGKVTQEQMDKALANLTLTTKVEDLKDVDILIEAIGGGSAAELENKDLKLKIFKELDSVVKKEAILSSNTSFFTISDLAAVTNRKDKFCGTHFFSPVVAMKVVEVVWTPETSKDTIDAAVGFCQKVGKIPVRVKDVPGDTGFIGNRIYFAAVREAQKVMKEGIVEKPEDIDAVMTMGFNWPIGPMMMGGGARSGWK
ncbi:MAG: 3-hydroxyacyl-CoA dehydrogenase family protein [Chloroflexota bacterium]|nr:MAG: 3-hydroxyacyl-CoA dehydrogenase family protein [Chloroflexota bacterium]